MQIAIFRGCASAGLPAGPVEYSLIALAKVTLQCPSQLLP